MKRREFLNLGGATVVAGSMSLPAFAAAPNLPVMDGVIAGIDALIADTRKLFRVRETQDPQLTSGLEDLWTSLAVYSVFLELPLEQQVHPAIQRRMHEVGAGFSRGVRQFVNTLAEDDPALWERMEHGRARMPEAEAILADADAQARRLGVGGQARRRLHTMMRRAIRELRVRGVRESAREFAEAATRTDLPDPMADAATTEAVVHARSAWREAGVEDTEIAPSEDSKNGLRTLGIVFVAIGATLVVIGLAMAFAFSSCFCIGGLVVLIGLGFLIPGIIFLTREPKRER